MLTSLRWWSFECGGASKRAVKGVGGREGRRSTAGLVGGVVFGGVEDVFVGDDLGAARLLAGLLLRALFGLGRGPLAPLLLSLSLDE